MRTLIAALLIGLAAVVVVACSDDDAGSTNGAAPSGSPDGDGAKWSAQDLDAANRDIPLRAIVANSPGALSLGANRVTFAFFDVEGNLVHDVANASLRVFRLDGDDGTLVTESGLLKAQLFDEDHHATGADVARERSAYVSASPPLRLETVAPAHEDPLVTMYAANVEFDRTEWWGAELSAERGGERFEGMRIRFFVQERSPEPMIGELVPRTEQQVLGGDVTDFAEVGSSSRPNPLMHQMTVAQAVDSGLPTVIGLTTPLFCQTRFCGPVLEQVIRPLLSRYGHEVNVLHIEPFDLAEARAGRFVPVPMMAEWSLQTEPWVFVIDQGGRLAAKFEGVVTEDEVVAVIERLFGR